jgi:DNA-binding NarL/FixJ family response regulator
LDTPSVRLAILYDHPLLGEGVGRLLSREPNIDVVYVESRDSAAVGAAIAAEPDMVVVERTCGIDPLEILRRAPSTMVIEVGIAPGPTWVYRRQEIAGDPQAVLGLVRRLRGGHPQVGIEPPVPTRHLAGAPT